MDSHKITQRTEPQLPLDAAESNRVYRKVAWRIIPFLMICYVLAYLDRANIGLAKIVLTTQLGFNDAIYGFGAGLFYLGYCLFEIPSNLLLKKMGAKLVFMRITILWGLTSAAFAFMTRPEHFYVLRFLLGAAESGLFPGVLLYLTYWTPVSRRAQFTAIFMSSMALAGLIGGPISGWLMTTTHGAAGLQGWQWMFLLEGAPSCILGVLTYFVLADNPAKARWLTDRERDILRRDLQRDAAKIQIDNHPSFVQVLRNPKVYVLGCMSIALISGIGGVSLWLPSILHRSGVTNIAYLGLLSGVPYAAAIVSQQTVAWRSDRKGERRWHTAIPAMLGGAGWLLLPFASGSPSLSLTCLTVVAAGTFGATGPFWSMPAAYLRGTASAAGIAAVTTLGGLSAFFSPLLVGWTAHKTGSLASGQVYYGTLLLAASLIVLAGTRIERTTDRALL